ncbi:hypothetical protein PVAG01_00946 [Phlyctema vagabunda]|uniref:3'-5' exoribonuclease Rv2179c-like domain-containing protein n=1 Tax=Phlyctema vagabunda TaxID=108571 RepID=A0ABR4PVP5_9HELO
METPAATGENENAQDAISRLEADIQKLKEENEILRKSKNRTWIRTKDWHCNIMLDLECAAAFNFNPIILEIGAIHFEIETGKELSSFHSIVNWESCEEHGLVQDDSTIDFLRTNIPETFQKSKEGGEGLPIVLRKFSTWILKRKTAAYELNKELAKQTDLKGTELQEAFKRPHAMIWGNGASSDNPWIKSAFKACGLPCPWRFYNDRCYRTLVEEWNPAMARVLREPRMFQGQVKHSAIEDCKHQVAVLVRARNEMHGCMERVEVKFKEWSEMKTPAIAKASDASSTICRKRKSGITSHTVRARSRKVTKLDLTRFRRTTKERVQDRVRAGALLDTARPDPDPSMSSIVASIVEEVEKEYNAVVGTKKPADAQPTLNIEDFKDLERPKESSGFSNQGHAVKTSMGLITPSTSFSGPPAPTSPEPKECSSSPVPEWWNEFQNDDWGEFQ